MSSAAMMRCGWTAVSHRLHSKQANTKTVSPVAVGPQFPIGYTSLLQWFLGHRVAVGPQFPIGYTGGEALYADMGVAVGPQFPIGYTLTRDAYGTQGVAVGPQFPIGYTPKRYWPANIHVAVGPQFPIGYTLWRDKALKRLPYSAFLPANINVAAVRTACIALDSSGMAGAHDHRSTRWFHIAYP